MRFGYNRSSCNDGRKGIITATRQRGVLNGSGRVRLNDGMEADFVFGDAAAAFSLAARSWVDYLRKVRFGRGAQMIDIGIAVVGAIFYFNGQYGLALLLILLAIISGLGAVVRSIANPNWYIQKRMQAGLDVNAFSPGKGIGSLIVTKAIVIAILTWAAWYIATKAGYV